MNVSAVSNAHAQLAAAQNAQAAQRAVAAEAAQSQAVAPTDSVERLTGLGVRVIKGHAKFIDRRTVGVGDIEIRARRFVVATGSAPAPSASRWRRPFAGSAATSPCSTRPRRWRRTSPNVRPSCWRSSSVRALSFAPA